MYVLPHMWRSEDVVELDLSFLLYVGSVNQTHISLASALPTEPSHQPVSSFLNQSFLQMNTAYSYFALSRLWLSKLCLHLYGFKGRCCLSIYVCICHTSAYGGREGLSDPLELECRRLRAAQCVRWELNPRPRQEGEHFTGPSLWPLVLFLR